MEIRHQPHRKKGQWVVYWRSAWTGARHHQGFPSEAAAREFVDSLNALLAREKELMARRRRRERASCPRMTVEELFQRYLSVALSNRTTAKQAAYHAAHILTLYGQRQAIRLTSEDMLQFMELQKVRGLCQATINRRISILRSALNWAVKMGILPQNPLSGLRLPQARPQRMAPPTPEELRRIFHAAEPHVRRVIVLGAYCGPRIGPSELFRLRWKDVDLENGIIRMPNAAKGAKESARELPIRESILPLLRQWLDEDMRSGAEHVVHWQGQSVRTIHRAWHTALRRAGIHRRITPYSLRHAYATYSVQGGAKLKPLAKLMGHRNELMILRTYQHVLDKDEREAVEAMPDVLRLERPAKTSGREKAARHRSPMAFPIPAHLRSTVSLWASFSLSQGKAEKSASSGNTAQRDERTKNPGSFPPLFPL